MTNQQLSSCHQAPVNVSSGAGDFSDHEEGVTMCYMCSRCGQVCDLYVPKQSKLDEILEAMIPIPTVQHKTSSQENREMTQIAQGWRKVNISKSKQEIKELFLEIVTDLEQHYAKYLDTSVGKKRAKFANEMRQKIEEL